ncbi:hypothetical protein HPB51_016890 [Rhipicephalus microplus]|uniref:Uncharacterized protein n=1 Tax=Rhipicephalus microplus TaxID=6941 RepID=A0A9J6E1K8_RHIMP|nr:hypothetical protein HPB51_016890 [Rhipicephalus microplus]
MGRAFAITGDIEFLRFISCSVARGATADIRTHQEARLTYWPPRLRQQAQRDPELLRDGQYTLSQWLRDKATEGDENRLRRCNVGGLVLFSMMSDDRKSSNAVRLLSSSACGFGVSSATMLMANISSPACAFYLPRTLYGYIAAFHDPADAAAVTKDQTSAATFEEEHPILHFSALFHAPAVPTYVLFHGLGAICYLVGAFCVSQYTQEVPLHSRIGFGAGVLHALHSAYASFKVYVQKSSSGWF